MSWEATALATWPIRERLATRHAAWVAFRVRRVMIRLSIPKIDSFVRVPFHPSPGIISTPLSALENFLHSEGKHCLGEALCDVSGLYPALANAYSDSFCGNHFCTR